MPIDPDRPGSQEEPSDGGRMRTADLSSIGLVFPIAALLGYWVGSKIGSWFDAEKAGGLIGLGFGIVSGFYNVWKVARRLSAEEDRLELERSSRSKEGP